MSEREGFGYTPDQELTPKVLPYTIETGVDIRYGEKTWRPVQSVIDIIQNHLDANTAAYEKTLLDVVGITEFNPEDSGQQALIHTLEQLRSTNDSAPLFDKLRFAHRIAINNEAQMKAALEAVNFTVPSLRLKVGNGKEVQLVDSRQLAELPEEWRVLGFRVQDEGSGFDYRLLGMVGASTKKQSQSKRGGLGEGLKMSIAHLARSGAQVRLYSKNADQRWVARPSIVEDTLQLAGRNRQEDEALSTGSLTDIDFSTAHFSETERSTILNALDPREGEAVGKYILEYRDPRFAGIINESTELTEYGVPAGRIYVKGLLVEERNDLLLSYNIGHKWAIAGRDRKTVAPEALTSVVQETFNRLDEESIVRLLTALATDQDYKELALLNSARRITSAQRPVWQAAIAKCFDFTLNKTLLASGVTTTESVRLARQKGYAVVTIPARYRPALYFFESLYPGQTVTLDQLKTAQQEPLLTAAEKAEQPATEVRPETMKLLNTYKSISSTLYQLSAVEGSQLGYGQLSGLNRLKSLRYASMNGRTSGNQRFEYNAIQDVLLVDEAQVETNTESFLDFFAELSKVIGGTDVFSSTTQHNLDRTVTTALLLSNPDLLQQLDIGLEGPPLYQERTYYTPELQESDRLGVEYFAAIEEINQVQSLTDLRQTLAVIRTIALQLKSAGLEDIAKKGSQLNYDRYFWFDGRFYELQSSDFTLEEQTVLPVRSDFNLRGSLGPAQASFITDNPYGLSARPTGLAQITDTYAASSQNEMRATSEPIFPQGSKPQLIVEGQKTPQTMVDILNDALRVAELKGRTRSTNTEAALRYAASFNTSKLANSEVLTKREEFPVLDPQLKHVKLGPGSQVYLPLTLADGVTRFSFKEGEQEVQVIARRVNGNLRLTKTVAGQKSPIGLRKSDLLFVPGSEQDVSKKTSSAIQAFQTSLTAYGNVLFLKSIHECEVTIDPEPPVVQVESETNEGKAFIPANITLDYGGDVWRDPKRVLIDAIQNHIDAQPDMVPALMFTVANSQGEVRNVEDSELRTLEAEWQIIALDIRDTGNGYATPYLTKLGRTSKNDETLGKYGEGLKMLAASAIRRGISVGFASHNWIASPTAYTQTVKDYETSKQRDFNFLGYQMQWLDQPREGSRTSFAILPVASDQQRLSSEQQVAMQQRLNDAELGKIWREWVEVLDPRMHDEQGKAGLERYVLPETSELPTDGIVQVLLDKPGAIYEKRLLIPGTVTEPFLFGYNIEETIINTRERNVFDEKLLKQYLARYFDNLTDVRVMKTILEQMRDEPTKEYYEYQFINLADNVAASKEKRSNWLSMTLWRQTYYEVFGPDAILSLAPEFKRQQRLRAESQLSRAKEGMFLGLGDELEVKPGVSQAIAYYMEKKGLTDSERQAKQRNPLEDYAALEKAVANEVHVETQNLRILPEAITRSLAPLVYTSGDALKDREGKEISLTAEQQRRLGEMMTSINQRLAESLDRFEQSEEGAAWIAKIAEVPDYQERKKVLRLLSPDNVKIKDPSWDSGGQYLDMDGQPLFYLNQRLFSDKRELLSTYVHEVAHYLSGQKDYVPGFQWFLATLTFTNMPKI